MSLKKKTFKIMEITIQRYCVQRQRKTFENFALLINFYGPLSCVSQVSISASSDNSSCEKSSYSLKNTQAQLQHIIRVVELSEGQKIHSTKHETLNC